MKKIVLSLAMMVFATMGFAQYDGFEIVEVDNGGIVPGKTYRVYVKTKNVGDGLDIVFGAEGIGLKIESTKPFYQHKNGGLSSKDISPAMIKLDPKLEFDSYITINRTDNTDNELAIFAVEGKVNLDPKEFEKNGGALATNDGAWYCIPLKPQTLSGEDKRVLIGQFTTKGVVTGTVNLQGKINDGENTNWRVDQVSFTCGK